MEGRPRARSRCRACHFFLMKTRRRPRIRRSRSSIIRARSRGDISGPGSGRGGRALGMRSSDGFGGWWLVVGGWWLVVGGWWLAGACVTALSAPPFRRQRGRDHQPPITNHPRLFAACFQSGAGGMAERPGLRPDEQTEIPFRRRQDAPRGWFSGSLRRVAVLGPYRSASGGQVGRRSRSLERPGYPPRSSTPGRRPLGGPCAGPAPPVCTGGPPLHPLPPPLRIAGRASLPCDGTG